MTSLTSPSTADLLQDGGDNSFAGFFSRIVLDHWIDHGQSPERLVQCCPAAALLQGGDIDARIPGDSFLEVCSAVQHQLQEPLLALQLGLRMKPSYLGPYGFALISARTGRELQQQASRYSLLAIGVGRNVFDVQDDVCIRYWRSFLPERSEGDLFLGDMFMASSLMMIRQILGVPDVAPTWASFRQAQPQDTSLYQQIFKCSLRFGAEDFAMAFDSRYLDLPLPMGAHPEVLSSMNALCERMLSDLTSPKDPDWLIACRKAIVDSFKSGTPDLNTVSARLNMAPATLRAHLARRATSFRQIAEELRHELALKYLRDPALSLVDVAYLLGFSEQSAFQRAFKRRTGMTPGEYRKR